MSTYVCNENINMTNVNKLLASSKVTTDHKIFLKRLKAHMKKTDTHAIQFQTMEKIGKMATGRLYAKYKYPSLQTCPRVLRGALGDQYVEVDLINCFPCIFHQLFTKNGIESPPVLEQYVASRADFAASLQLDVAEVKRAMNMVMNFGTCHVPVINEFGAEF